MTQGQPRMERKENKKSERILGQAHVISMDK